MENTEKKSFWKNMRRDSGELRVLIVFSFSLIALMFGISGEKIIKSGVAGEWEIVSSFKGWTLYITSISPGLLVFVLATLILCWGLPRVLKNL